MRTHSHSVHRHRRCVQRPSESSCRLRSCMLGVYTLHRHSKSDCRLHGCRTGAHRLQRHRQGRHSLSRRYWCAVSGVHRGHRRVSMLRTYRLTTGRHPTMRKDRWCDTAWWQAYRRPKAKVNWCMGGRWGKEGGENAVAETIFNCFSTSNRFSLSFRQSARNLSNSAALAASKALFFGNCTLALGCKLLAP